MKIHHVAPQQRNTKETTPELSGRLNFVLTTIFVAGLLISGATLAFYFFYFHGSVSVNPNVWASFGSFLGGTLGPLFAFLTFIALLFTISIQAKELSLSNETLKATQHELKLAREAAETRAQQFREEMTKSELFNMIKFVHSELERRFEGKADFSPSGKSFGHYFSYSAPSTGRAAIPSNGVQVSENDRILLLDIIELTGELNGYLAQYKAQFGESALTYFYARRYSECAKRLTEKGFVIKEMMTAFQSVGYGWSATISQPSSSIASQKEATAAHDRR